MAQDEEKEKRRSEDLMMDIIGEINENISVGDNDMNNWLNYFDNLR